MKRQLTSILLFSALLVGGASTFVSCTDHESDSAYNTSISLADAIAKQKAELTDLNAELKKKADKTTVEADKLALEGRIKANEDAITAFNNSPVGELAKYATLDAAIQGSKAYTDLKKTVDDHIKAIEDLRKKDEEAAEKFTKALNKRLEKIEGSVSDEAKAREKVQAVYDQAFDYLVNKNLTSIAINATENPVLGYYNAAFLGSKLNLVSSFYGTAAQNQDWDITKGEFLNNGDAGKIYITLNPNEIDPECITDLKLVDSQGNEAKGFKLGDEEGNLIKTTDKVLTYGFTKAASANGFYEVPVRATDPANDDFSLNKGELKEAAKNIVAKLQNPKKSNLNLSQIATTLYRSVNNQLKAYTVKATYYLYDPTVTNEDGTKGALVEKHQIAPTYDMAAFAVKPLSFNTLKDNQSLKNLGLALDKYMLPTLSDKLGKFMDALDFQIKNENGKQIKMYSMLSSKNIRCWEEGNDVIISNSNGETYTLKNTKIAKDLSSWNLNTEEYKYVPEWGGYAYTDLAVGEYERLFVFETTDNTIDELIGSINEQIGTKLQPVKDAITNAATKWDNAITPVNNLLHKINANIGNVNQLLQPTMLYKSTKTNSWNVLSTLKGTRGTRMTGTGSTVLVATSWTGELLAPAYKKSVYVKGNPAGAKVTLMDGKTPAKKFAGSTQKVLFTATAPGNYTIVYEAVDYSGVSAEPKEYHITVE
ncbi:hypothetical protein F7D95_05670 [Prevotella copri]|uniref:Uncharacterized protein n=1 Tax=Segatella copri TaxID=165179 RepID=A0AA90ZL40_9BACT|nr:hypothetical protein [Segatella copri]MQN12319.1 hypothetical protein [Segatella copri]